MQPPAQKAFVRGTHRAVSPTETLARVRPLLPLLGVTRIANLTGLDSIGIPVVMVCRPNSRSVAVSQGKGLDLDAAKTSGVMEALESFHAERADLPLRLASFLDMRFSGVADVARLPRLSASPYHPALRILWAQGTDLLSGKPTWVPFELVHTCYTLPLPTGSGCFSMSSNGLASGNHPLEAIAHGLSEVIERDANAVFHARGATGRERARLDLSTVDDAPCRSVLDAFDRASIAVAVWETTTDIGVASYLCSIVDRAPDRLRPLPPSTGSGCHPAREIALLRALTEAAQARLTLISGARDELSHLQYERVTNLDAVLRILDHAREADPALTTSKRPFRAFHDAPTHAAETFDEDVAWMLDRLSISGIEQAIVVDLTRREIGVPVVRVIVPGLEALHDAPGYVPGPRARAAMTEPA